MKLRLPLNLRARVIACGSSAAAAACMLSSGWASASIISTNVTLDDTSSESAAAGSIVAGTTYGKITSSDAITFNDVSITVTHGEGSTLDTWAGLVISRDGSSVDGAVFIFNNTTLAGNGNLALAFQSGNGGATTTTDLTTLDGQNFTGRLLLMDQWNNGLTANYSGALLQNTEIVLAKDGTSYTVGGSSISTGSNRTANVLNLAGDASLSGISAEAKGTSGDDSGGYAKDSLMTTSGAGTNTLTLTGGCTTNQTSVFAGNAGTSSAYFNLVQQGGSQTFSGTNYFGSVSVTGGTLILGGTTTVKGDVSVTNGVLNLSGATIGDGKNVALGGGRIDNLTLRVGNTLSQTDGSGTLGNLTLSGGTISFAGLNGASYSLTGTLTLGSLTTLDFSGSTGYADGTTLFSRVMFGEGFTWNDDAWARYFTLTGTEENWKIVYDQDSNVFKLAANTAAELTWDNAAGTGSWKLVDANWGDGSTTFRTGDAVTFSGTTGTITVDAAGVLASKVTVTNGSDLVLAGGAVTGPVNIDGASSLTVDNTVTGAISLAGSSTLTVGTAGTLDAIMTFGDAESKLVLTKTNAFSATSTVVGSGIVEVKWGTQTGNVNAQLGNFNGTLQITSGCYDAGSSSLAASVVNVADGGQIYIGGGTWNQTFNLAGTGWNLSADIAKDGSLRLDNATITGEVNLTSDTMINVWSGTGTITTALNGEGKTLTKVGGGTLKLSNTTSAIGTLLINKGTVLLSSQGTYGNIGSVTIGSEGTLKLGDAYGVNFTCSDITINGGGKLQFQNGPGATIGTSEGTIRILASESSHAIIAGNWGGDTTIASKLIGTGVLELQQMTYVDPVIFSNKIQDSEGGKLSILLSGGRSQYTFSAENTYSGGTTIMGGFLTAAHDGALGTGDVEVREGGVLQANGVALSNNISVKNAGANETRATIAKRGAASGVHYSNAQIDGTGISSTAASKATVSHAEVSIEKTYNLSSVSLVDSLVTIQSSGIVTLTDVAVGADSAIVNTAGGTATMAGTSSSVTLGLTGTRVTESLSFTPAGSESSLTFIGVTTSQLNGVTMSDGAKLTIDLANDLLCNSALRDEQYLAVTFEGLTGANALADANFDLSPHLTAGFTGAAILGVEATTGGTVVYIGFAPAAMPEPTSSLLTLFGFSGLLLRRRRKA